jgi:hypothetical protein
MIHQKILKISQQNLFSLNTLIIKVVYYQLTHGISYTLSFMQFIDRRREIKKNCCITVLGLYHMTRSISFSFSLLLLLFYVFLSFASERVLNIYHSKSELSTTSKHNSKAYVVFLVFSQQSLIFSHF